ncbi:hypothetical protein CAC42_3741 [Sphaceloma murrayae]|uniref:aminodeoxychorismate synthase n=1 Tax=Sphaceloma murrayae TaxID=2082308 RepID=A0A2K1QH12_9PEZI|nr:hypothetical protein CAC42_3741 [Sphaceloma murrayae]
MTDRHPAASPKAKGRPRLLFLDAYDSFTNNIIALLRSSLQARVTVVKIDDPGYLHCPDSVFHAFLRRFDGVVVGPGPGDPRKPDDTGLIDRLWQLPDLALLPILGICLGFQSLVLAFGGNVVRLTEPRHGVIRHVEHTGRSLFEKLGEVQATQYHSLHGKLDHDLSDPTSIWKASASVPELEPLAWDLSDEINGPVLMAVKHVIKPFLGVQYHPESICTNSQGAGVIKNWWRESLHWIASRVKPVSRESPLSTGLDSGYVTDVESVPSTPEEDVAENDPIADNGRLKSVSPFGTKKVIWRKLPLPSDCDAIPIIGAIVERETGQNPLVLESGTKHGEPIRAETGRFSILGVVDRDTDIFQYWTSRHILRRRISGVVTNETCDMAGAFEQTKSWLSTQQAVDGPSAVPFWGGLVGYISYEAGLETISVEPPGEEGDHADLHFVFVQRSVVVDHVEKSVYVQSVVEKEEDWIEDMSRHIEFELGNARRSKKDADRCALDTPFWRSQICRPEMVEYCEKVESCHSHIRAGDSYELCLTAQSPLTFFEDEDLPLPSPWELYSRLRQTNPAPFGAFLDFENVSILSSSPERFLSWSRDGICEFRPIKGTVRKGEGMTREKAEGILKSEKEQAENLMIVDLIRHDMNGVVGLCGGEATVPKLMQVEEYETVHQLVSVIRGQLDPPGLSALSGTSSRSGGERTSVASGIDVLQASLPPGSMTGAPKKRSCELLKQVEGSKRRRIYSGVLGYLDIGGGGDFSVVIRSAIRYNDGWKIGAGGAITALSDPLAEYEEMMGKSMAVQL